jgi:hypothetical protein
MKINRKSEKSRFILIFKPENKEILTESSFNVLTGIKRLVFSSVCSIQ